MPEKKKPSEIIQDFISLMESSHSEYSNSMEMVKETDSRTITRVHELENCPNKQERNRLATKWQRERIERRKHKNNAVLYKKLHEFANCEANKPTLKRLKNLALQQRKTEEYLDNPNKEFKHKVGDST